MIDVLTLINSLWVVSLGAYIILKELNHKDSKIVRTILLAFSFIGLLYNASYSYLVLADGSFFMPYEVMQTRNSRWSDVINDWNVGHNLLIGKGYTIDILMYGCSKLPCDARNRPPLNAMLLGLFDSPHQAMYMVFLWFFLSLFLLYVISKDILVPISFILMPVVIPDLAFYHYEFLHFVLFLCCLTLCRKGGFWFAAACSLLALGSLPIAVGVIVAGLFFTKGSRWWMLLPIITLLLYVVWAGGSMNQRTNSMFVASYQNQSLIGHQLLTLPSFTLSEKVMRYSLTFLEFMVGGLLLFLYLSPLVFEAQLSKPNKFIWVAWLVSVLAYSFFSYSPRYEFILLSLLAFMGGKDGD